MATQTSPNDTHHSGTRPFDAPNTLVGRVVDGRYRLDEVLIGGGMGIVFEAVQLNVSRKIAVKILRPTLSNETDLVQRFSQEIEVVASLSHPNIVALIDAGRDAGGLTYLAMEYVDGSTFREALDDGCLSLVDILEVLVQTCNALMEAHRADIIHRDLKFDNIMLTRHEDGRVHVKILDFGVAKLLSKNRQLTRSGQVPGTPGVIAPELVDERPPTPRSDLYSLGVLLYTALCGQAPFTGQNDLELMRAHKLDDVPDLTGRVGAEVPAELVELTYQLLEKRPEDRPETARQVRGMLEGIMGRLRQEPYSPAYDPTGRLQTSSGVDNSLMDTSPQMSGDRVESPDIQRPPAVSYEGVERFVRAFFGDEPVIAPTTVVVGLAMLLFALALTIVYMFAPRWLIWLVN